MFRKKKKEGKRKMPHREVHVSTKRRRTKGGAGGLGRSGPKQGSQQASGGMEGHRSPAAPGGPQQPDSDLAAGIGPPVFRMHVSS